MSKQRISAIIFALATLVLCLASVSAITHKLPVFVGIVTLAVAFAALSQLARLSGREFALCSSALVACALLAEDASMLFVFALPLHVAAGIVTTHESKKARKAAVEQGSDAPAEAGTDEA